MRARSPLVTFAAFAALTASAGVSAVILATPRVAHAEVDCPPGSTRKTEGANAWCEPSVCANDAQCAPGELCKPVPLCVEVGTLKSGAALTDAGQRLMARQRCGPDKSCPQATVCSDMSRCLSPAEAEKMGLVSVPSGSASPAGASSGGSGKSCGCRVPGGASSGLGGFGGLGGASLAVLGVIGLAKRRRQRADRR